MRTWVAGLLFAAACGGGKATPDAAADSTTAALPSAGAPAAHDTGIVTSTAPAPTGSTGPAAQPVPTMSGVRGKVVVSGTANTPITTLQVVAGPMVVLRGSLEPELRALAGATVMVSGSETMENNRRIINVTVYDVVDINGERPSVGVLLQPQQLATATDTLDLVPAVKAAPGSKVWITGDRSGKQLKVRSYGVIR